MSYSRLFVVFFACVNLLACHNLQKKAHFTLQKGDLLFQDLDSDAISDAIESVTDGKKNLNFSHVGIVDIDLDGEFVVLEAISKGVVLTRLDSFLMRSTTSQGKPKVVVGRLTSEFSERIDSALRYGRKLIGADYDYVYMMGDSNYYCSELIYEMFLHSPEPSEVFQLHPMTFKDTSTGEFLPFWIKYYHELGVEIPEGKPGLNPNGMSQSANIDLIYSYEFEKKPN